MASDSLTWTMRFGHDGDGDDGWDGNLSPLVVASGASDTPASDRYASGDGQPMEGAGAWLDTWGDDLVTLLAGDDQAGVGQAGDSLVAYGASGTPAHDPLLSDAGYQTLALVESPATPRVVLATSRPGFPYPYVAVNLNGQEVVEAWARDDAGSLSGPAASPTGLSSGWHTVGFGYDGTDLYVTVDGEKVGTAVQPSGDFDDLAETTIGAIRLGVVSHFLGLGAAVQLGRILVWDAALTAPVRRAAHNELRDTYTDLVEASA